MALLRRGKPPSGPRRRRYEEASDKLAEAMYYDWDIGWQYDSACRGEDSDLFFAPNYFERKEEKEAREAKAKAICSRCSVREECLDYALRNREPHGIWGGLNEVERKAIIRERERSARRAG
jgi:WhiB family redox-sensing transcriptional regulator